jgi:hypothetical protein
VRRLLAIGTALVATVALAGCGDGDDSDLPAFTGEGGTAAPSASSTATPDPTGGTGGPLPKKGEELGAAKNAITVGRVVRGDAEKEAVQQAYLQFWATRATALYEAKLDNAAVTAVATGDAAASVVRSVRAVAEKKHHTEGGSTVNVQTVAVEGSKATLVDCFRDRSLDLTADGSPAEQPDFGLSVFEVSLVKAGDVWKVSAVGDSDFSKCREK